MDCSAALLSPVLVGAASDGTTIAMLAVGAACSMWVVLWRRWPALAVAAVLVCAPQWVAWILRGHSTMIELAGLTVFGLLGLLGAMFAHGPSPQRVGAGVSMALALLNAVLVGVLGRVLFGRIGGGGWLVGVAVVYAVAALWRWPRVRFTKRCGGCCSPSP